MSNTQSQFESLESESVRPSLSVSRKLHPEDIRVGDDVAISEVMYQYPSYPWQGCASMLQPQDSVDVTFLSPPDTTPMIVKSVCLPFVLCKTETYQHKVFDLRQVQLVRLDKEFAKEFRASRKADRAEFETSSKEQKRKKKKRKSGKDKKKKKRKIK